MDETFMLILLALVMLIGSYLAGSIPLVVSMSPEKLKIVTIFGAGLLVGTALTVIIPEGIRALYSDVVAAHHSHHQRVGVGAVLSAAVNTVSADASAPFVQRADGSPVDGAAAAAAAAAADSETDSEPTEHSATIGLSLVLGFVFMMLVDQISTRRNEKIPLQSDRNSTATIGLVVHAAADGIALGAAATTSHQDVEMIVFLAIMLHKAPAAFGLVSFLLHEGIDRKRIRKHLAIFSIAAPLLALLTYFGIGAEQKETLNSVNATGIAMLFSAGTFLYVATVHVLPELTTGGGGGHHHHHHHGTSSMVYSHLEEPLMVQTTSSPAAAAGVAAKGYGSLRNGELCMLITGALLPLLLTMGHHH